MSLSKALIISIASFFCFKTYGQTSVYPAGNPVELGKVAWLRNFDEAKTLAEKQGMPILILFQEVPGCANCTRYGNEVLSHPLIVEVIETCFVPLCIYNNKTGQDSDILKIYNEPSWNNPVVRIVNHRGKDLVPRQPEFGSVAKTLESIINGISLSGQEVPQYISLLKVEYEAAENGSASDIYFSMYCFWSGEKEIGAIDGVISTEAGYMHGKEVVKVTYRADKIDVPQLYNNAQKKGCADDIYGSVRTMKNLVVKPAGNYRKDPQDKYFIYGSDYKYIPMTELQKTKVNSALGLNSNPDIYLSPRQLKWLKAENKKNHLSGRIEKVWWKS